MGIGSWIKKKGEEQTEKWREEKVFKQAKREAYEAEYKKARMKEGIRAEHHAAKSRARMEARRDAGRHGLGGGFGFNVGELPSVGEKIQRNAERPLLGDIGPGRGGAGPRGEYDPFGTGRVFGGREKGRTTYVLVKKTHRKRQPREPSFW